MMMMMRDPRDTIARARTTVILQILAASLAVVYLRYYLKYNPSVELLQTSVSNASLPKVLAEKLPIVLDESIVHVESLLQTIFKYQYCYSRRKQVDIRGEGAPWIPCRARFTLVWSASASAEVDVRHPMKPLDIIRVKLRADQPLILPPRWLYKPITIIHAASKTGTPQNYIKKADVLEVFDFLHLAFWPLAPLLLTHRA